MGRMFRIITDRQEQTLNQANARPSAYFVADTIPYVEVGGPEGVVTSIHSPASQTAKHITHIPVREVAPQQVYTQPVYQQVQPVYAQPVYAQPQYTQPQYTQPTYQPVHQPQYLSVQLHRVVQQPMPMHTMQTVHSDVVPEVVAYHQPQHGVSNEYRVLKDEIRQQLTEIGPKAIYFTSAKQHSGTTTVLLNLAATLALETNESKVIVVDADFDTPISARRLAAGEHHGLTDVLGQNVPLAWAIQPTGVPRVQVLSAGVSELRAAGATDMPRLITQLKQWFDYVLIDGGRWGQRTDRDTVVTVCDAVYAVSRSTDLERTEFTNLRNTVAHAGGQLRGYITTRV